MYEFIVVVLCTLAFAAGCIATCVVISRRVARSSASDNSNSLLPDFVVVDCGDQIHFIPLPEKGHQLGRDGCECHPRRTANRRRVGGRVVYVDHQSLRHQVVIH